MTTEYNWIDTYDDRIQLNWHVWRQNTTELTLVTTEYNLYWECTNSTLSSIVLESICDELVGKLRTLKISLGTQRCLETLSCSIHVILLNLEFYNQAKNIPRPWFE